MCLGNGIEFESFDLQPGSSKLPNMSIDYSFGDLTQMAWETTQKARAPFTIGSDMTAKLSYSPLNEDEEEIRVINLC